LEEMAWMATDFHEERKWKKAAGGLMSRAAASEARRRVARERGVGEETSRICHRLSTGVMTFWRGVSSQIRYFNDSQAMLQQEQQAVLAKEAAAAAKEEGGGEEEDEEEDEEEEEDSSRRRFAILMSLGVTLCILR
jgi:ribosomal protein S2